MEGHRLPVFAMGFYYRLFTCLFVLCSNPVAVVQAQEINGTVYDYRTNKPMALVTVVNTFTEQTITTDSTGTFRLRAKKGQLIEWRRLGYKISRVRADSPGVMYKIMMKEASYEREAVFVPDTLLLQKTEMPRELPPETMLHPSKKAPPGWRRPYPCPDITTL